MVQEKYDAKQSTALHTDDCTAVQRGGQKQPPVIHRANSQDCTHQGKEKGGVYSLGKRSKVPGVILRKSYTRAWAPPVKCGNAVHYVFGVLIHRGGADKGRPLTTLDRLVHSPTSLLPDSLHTVHAWSWTTTSLRCAMRERFTAFPGQCHAEYVAIHVIPLLQSAVLYQFHRPLSLLGGL